MSHHRSTAFGGVFCRPGLPLGLAEETTFTPGEIAEPRLRAFPDHAKLSRKWVVKALGVNADGLAPPSTGKDALRMLIDLENLLRPLIHFSSGHTTALIGLAAVLLFLVWFRPRAMLKVAGLIAAFALAAYMFSLAVDMAGTGRSQKKEMVHKVE